jgi:transcriptional regulator with XRE-family HTH domain
MSIDIKKIGLFIQELRKRKNITQNQLGERLNVSYQAVSKWERGETLPDTLILLDLAAILESTVDNILNGGERLMSFNIKISTKDIKTGVDYLCNIGNLIGKDNTVYAGMVEGVNTKMDIDLEECFNDSYKKEALIAEIIVQNLISGSYIDISDAQSYFEHEHWKDIVRKYASNYGIK